MGRKQETVARDLKAAMKAGEELAVSVLRMVSAALHNEEIAKRAKAGSEKLTDEEEMRVLEREVKKRREAAALYEKGGRNDLADRERREAELLAPYLPAQASEEEIRRVVEEALARLQAPEFGPAMKEIMKELRGKADAARVAEIVKNKLAYPHE